VLTLAPPRSEADYLEDQQDLRRRVTWLMLGRLGAVTLLLGGTAVLAVDQRRGFASFTPALVLGLIVCTYAMSLALALWLPRARRAESVAYVQTAWDLVLSTALVYVGGGVASGFTFLYGTAVLMAALVVGHRAAQLTTLVSLVMYVTLGLLVTNGSIPAPPDQPSERYLLRPTDATLSMLVNIFGLVLVAFLATNLAGRLRLAGGRLREAAAHAAELGRLNADIIRSMSSGLITTDSSGAISTLNPAALEIFRASVGTMLSEPITRFFLPESTHESDSPRSETVARRPDGSTFPAGFSRTPLVDALGRRKGELYLFQDLSELKELRAAAERAERLAALGRLAAGLAHEIRNPLGSISGSVQLVREAEELGSEDRRLLGIVLSEVDRLNALVTTMLDAVKPRASESYATDLVALTTDVLDMARRDPRHRDAAIELDAPPGRALARVDPNAMRQLIWNLLSNALAHAPAGSAIEIGIHSDSGFACWSISDKGPGVPLAARAHLFDMFYSKRPHGVGLGLALVDQLVRAHGGDITVDSQEGRGATFRVRVPLA
jgi:two-component system, NtrC family, sensor histidine kinase PilS